MEQRFRWRDGFAPAGLPADQAGEAIEKLTQELGREPTPADIVEAASDVRHPLHLAFEWDDEAAAHQHRIAQARKLVGALVVTVVRGRRNFEVRAFHSVRRLDGTRGYASLQEVTAREAFRHQVVADSLQIINGLEAKIMALGELSGEVAPILAELRRVLGKAAETVAAE